MKLVSALIKPHKLEDVLEALAHVGIAGSTVTEARGFGRQRGHTELYRGAEYTIDLVPKLRVEVVCDDRQVDGIIDAIVQGARTQAIGDGKISVTDVENVVRIRTGEAARDAL